MDSSLNILEILPHRYPFLLVDKIIYQDEHKVVGLKNVSFNEPQFQGHFPGYPVMPGVLLVEAMAQVGAVALLGGEETKGKIGLLVGIDKARFRRQIVPGDQLRIETEILSLRRGIGKGLGKVYVGDQLAAEAEIMFALADK